MKEIKSTKNYSLFKNLAGNRNVDPARVSKIKKSILKNGWFTNPILVNEKMEIIDGQGRYAALKELNMPIEYVVERGIGIECCINMNTAQTNWTIMDYVGSYAERGNENYQRLVMLMEECPGFGIHTYATALFQQYRFDFDIISKGYLIITPKLLEKAKENLEYLNQMNPYLKGRLPGRLHTLHQAIIIAKNLPGVDPDQLFNKVIMRIRNTAGWNTIGAAIQTLEEVYNYKSKKEYLYIYTLYRQQLEEKKELAKARFIEMSRRSTDEQLKEMNTKIDKAYQEE